MRLVTGEWVAQVARVTQVVLERVAEVEWVVALMLPGVVTVTREVPE